MDEWKRYFFNIPDPVNEEPELEVKSPEEEVTDLVNKILSKEGLIHKLLYQEGHRLLTDLSLDIPGFTDQWGPDSYRKLIGLILVFWFHDRHDNIVNQRAKAAVLKELTRRHDEDSKRTEKRDDRVDKLDFQKAVRANIEGYDTVEAAVHDLIIKPQFAKYEPETLWKWARKVWTKPITKGRPPKKRIQ